MASKKKFVHRVQMTEGKRNIIHQLLEEYDIQTAEDIQDALKYLLDGIIKEMMEAKMDDHLGYEKSERSDNDDYCNGYTRERVNSSYGTMEIEVPKDRKSTFEPQVVKKRQKDFSDIDQKTIFMYAKGMTIRKISETIEQLSEIETAVSDFSEIEKIYCYSTKYCSLNGEQKACLVSKYSDSFTVTEGREPRYDNEIIITEILADGYDLSIGDHVVIGYDDKKEDYIITGFFQSLCDTGNCFGMLETGAERIGANYIGFAGFSIAEPEKKQEIVDYLNKNFGNSLEAKTVDSIAGKTVEVIINVIKAVIFILSFVFALVAVYMVCEKCFLQEKDDIAIYHALGFTKKRLRLQFALRFLMIAGVGSVFGLVLSVLFSGKLLSMILRSLGIVSFHIDFTTDTFLIPVYFICVCFFLFAYFTSKRIKAFSNL